MRTTHRPPAKFSNTTVSSTENLNQRATSPCSKDNMDGVSWLPLAFAHPPLHQNLYTICSCHLVWSILYKQHPFFGTQLVCNFHNVGKQQVLQHASPSTKAKLLCASDTQETGFNSFVVERAVDQWIPLEKGLLMLGVLLIYEHSVTCGCSTPHVTSQLYQLPVCPFVCRSTFFKYFEEAQLNMSGFSLAANWSPWKSEVPLWKHWKLMAMTILSQTLCS